MSNIELREVTLVIPTYNRHEHLQKLVNYYAEKKSNISFIILDSSDSKTKTLNAQVIAQLGVNARHIEYPSSMPVASKLAAGLSEVNTQFCAFCADDDLVFFEGLSAALDYLRSHPACVCVDGIYLNFYKVGNDVRLKLEYGGKGIDANHPCARVFRLFQKYESLFYGVFRTENLNHIFSSVSQISSLHYQELFQSVSALLIGKSHRLPVFYAGRQHCDPAEESRDKWQTYYWFAENRVEFIEHYLSYRDVLWQFYGQYGAEPRLDKKLFEQSMDLAHAVFFGLNCPPSYFHSVLQPCWPDDAYCQPDPLKDDICHQLKQTRHRFWDLYLDPLIEFVQRKCSVYFARHDVSSLNSEVRNSTKTVWNCVLAKELRWLAGVDSFRHSYRELCLYLG